MLRQSSSRSQRAKGVKVKHAAQLFLLVTICIWLLYQVTHSHDVKKASGEGDAIETRSDYRSLETLKLGRKDLIDSEVKLGTSNELPEEGKEEPGEEETGIIMEEAEDEEGTGIGHDEIDVQDHEQADELEAKEFGDAIENESNKEEPESEPLENGKHDDVKVNSHGTWEEHYKRDDPSNAIVRQHEEMGGSQMEERERKTDVEASNSTSVSNSTHEIDESALQQENTGYHSVDTKADEIFSDSATAELKAQELASYLPTNSSADSNFEMHDSSNGNLSSFTSSQSRNGTVGVDVKVEDFAMPSNSSAKQNILIEESGWTAESKDMGEKPQVSLVTDKESTFFNEEDDALAKGGELMDEEKDSEVDLFTLPEDQSDTKEFENMAAE